MSRRHLLRIAKGGDPEIRLWVPSLPMSVRLLCGFRPKPGRLDPFALIADGPSALRYHPDDSAPCPIRPRPMRALAGELG